MQSGARVRNESAGRQGSDSDWCCSRHWRRDGSLVAAEGATVVLTDVLVAEGQAVASEVGSRAYFHPHDVSDEESWHDVVAAVVERFGAIDILVNNAAILVLQDLIATTKSDFERVLAINLVGPFLGIKTVAPHMTERRQGSIVNVSSVSGMIGQPGVGAYAASKWGVRGLTRVAALELGTQGVRVNSVHPGGVDTAMGAGRSTREAIQSFYAGIPLQRIGQPEEVAHAVLYLASDESAYVCGAELLIDGGMTAGRHYTIRPDAARSIE